MSTVCSGISIFLQPAGYININIRGIKKGMDMINGESIHRGTMGKCIISGVQGFTYFGYEDMNIGNSTPYVSAMEKTRQQTPKKIKPM